MILDMTSSTSQAVAGTIRAETARRQMSQRELAEKLGMSKSGLNRRVAGVQPWDLDELDKLANLFGMAPRDLLPTTAATP